MPIPRVKEAIFGKKLKVSIKDLNKLNSNDYDDGAHPSDYFRRQCKSNGYKLLELYPIYRIGWELDNWGAIGTKRGIQYALSTDHGSFIAKAIRKG